MSGQTVITDESVPRRRLDIRTRMFRGKLLVANADHAFELEDVAAFIVKHVDGVRTVREIGQRLAAAYELTEQEAVPDTAELLSQLIDHDVLEIVA
jgi:hypothetical protein